MDAQLIGQYRSREIIGQVILVCAALFLQAPVRHVTHDIAVPQLTAIFDLPHATRLRIDQLGRDIAQQEQFQEERMIVMIHYAIGLRVVVGFDQTLNGIDAYFFKLR